MKSLKEGGWLGGMVRSVVLGGGGDGGGVYAGGVPKCFFPIA